MNVVIGNDHAAIQLKHEVIEYLKNQGITVKDKGAQEKTSKEYPDYAQEVCNNILSGEYQLAILLCGTGAGMCITANKIRGIRSVVCSEPYTAQLSRAHNNANVLCLGARVVGTELAKLIVKAFLETPFEGGRHADRVAKISDIESRA